MKSTPHAHTNYVDGVNTPPEMVEAAILKGFDSLGFSEHGRQDFDLKYCLSEESEARYLAETRALQRSFKGRFPVWVGIERDEYGLARREDYDYVIGSKHYFRVNGQRYATDGALDEVIHCRDTLFSGDWYAFTEAYFADLADYVADDKPDIIGHFDVVSKHNEDGKLFDLADKRYLDAGFQALERMIKGCSLLEINTGAIARGYRTTPYPAPPFLRFWRELGGRAIISSDCHDARMLDCAFDQAAALARAAGYRTLSALGRGETLFETYPI